MVTTYLYFNPFSYLPTWLLPGQRVSASRARGSPCMCLRYDYRRVFIRAFSTYSYRVVTAAAVGHNTLFAGINSPTGDCPSDWTAVVTIYFCYFLAITLTQRKMTENGFMWSMCGMWPVTVLKYVTILGWCSGTGGCGPPTHAVAGPRSNVIQRVSSTVTLRFRLTDTGLCKAQ